MMGWSAPAGDFTRAVPARVDIAMTRHVAGVPSGKIIATP